MWLTLVMQAAQASCEQDGPQIFHQKAHAETAPEMRHTYVSVLNALQLSVSMNFLICSQEKNTIYM